MVLARLGNPNCGLPKVVSTPVYVTWFRTLVASTRQSKLRRSPQGNDRPSPRFSENWAGPRMELRPASPQLPAAGAAYAEGFAYRPPLPSTVAPVRLGRRLPV